MPKVFEFFAMSRFNNIWIFLNFDLLILSDFHVCYPHVHLLIADFLPFNKLFRALICTIAVRYLFIDFCLSNECD